MEKFQATNGFDIIGDVHGMASHLRILLAEMGYEEIDGAWRHPTRTAVFVGDYVDRGPEQLETYRMIRKMVNVGAGLAVMGNHEFNALAYHMPNGEGGHYRERNEKNRGQHAAFLENVEEDSLLHDEIAAWFLTLPLWLDLGGIRVVHACWDPRAIEALRPHLDDGNRLPHYLVGAAATGHSNSYDADGNRPDANPIFQAVETILKGIEVKMPQGYRFEDKYGVVRTSTRVAWWQGEGATYRSAAVVAEELRQSLPDIPLPIASVPGYDNEKPLFIGHYWQQGNPDLLTPKIACVDYSACNDGNLVAYRWSGEQKLTSANFFRA